VVRLESSSSTVRKGSLSSSSALGRR
jgi:hypothetical protein